MSQSHRSQDRVGWTQLPAAVVASVEAWLGERVVRADNQAGGFSPGLAARVLTEGGRRVFVKSVGPELNPIAPEFHRREIAVVTALPEASPAPRLLWSHADAQGWVTLAFEDVDGWSPQVPWRPAELGRVITLLSALAAALTPAPAEHTGFGTVEQWNLLRRPWWALLADDPPAGLDAWSSQHAPAASLLQQRAAPAAAGDTLLHCDLRADNILLTPARAYVVDWAHAQRGAAWVDPVLMAPSVALKGGPAPETFLDRIPALASAPEDDVTAVVAALAGFFTYETLQPSPPGLPALRAFQAAQGAIARTWLAERVGWPSPP